MDDWVINIHGFFITYHLLVLLGTMFGGWLLAAMLHKPALRLADRLEVLQRRLLALSLRSIANSMTLIFIILGARIGCNLLHIPDADRASIEPYMETILSIAIAIAAYRLADVLNIWSTISSDSRLDAMLVPLMRKTFRVAVVLTLIIYNVAKYSDESLTSVLTGLGVGGLAIALAAQDTLKNLLGSLVIFLDRPFEVGDRIVVDTIDGKVIEVGFRTTRVRTITDGQMVTIPNSDLASKSIRNLSARSHLRKTVVLPIALDGEPDRPAKALEILGSILENHPGMTADVPPVIQTSDFVGPSLNIQATFAISPPDDDALIRLTDHVNLEIVRRFAEAGIKLQPPAVPPSTK